MPLVLYKLPCGVIYTDTFTKYVQCLHSDEAPAHPGQVLTLEYVRCATGPQKGRAWWQTQWLPEKAVPEYRCFKLGTVTVHIPKSSSSGCASAAWMWRMAESS